MNPIPKVGQILYFPNHFMKDNRYRLVVEHMYLGNYRLQCIKTGQYSRINIGTKYLSGEDDHRDWEIISDPNDNYTSG